MRDAAPIVAAIMGYAPLRSCANTEALPSKASTRNPMSFLRNGVMDAPNALRHVH
jgi:hypothetical protein